MKKKYLPLIYQSGQLGCSRKSDAAILEDHILYTEGKPQKYGCIKAFNAAKGYYIIYPVQDRANLNKLRTEVGLKTIEDHMAKYNARWE